jgi:hypothetical protein
MFEKAKIELSPLNKQSNYSIYFAGADGPKHLDVTITDQTLKNL